MKKNKILKCYICLEPIKKGKNGYYRGYHYHSNNGICNINAISFINRIIKEKEKYDYLLSTSSYEIGNLEKNLYNINIKFYKCQKELNDYIELEAIRNGITNNKFNKYFDVKKGDKDLNERNNNG